MQYTLKYPVLLVHGVGHRDDGRLKYWGRIPAALERQGAAVFCCGQDAWGTIEDNARFISRRVMDIAAETGRGKVNIIAHSKGGLDARRAIHMDGMEDMVASLTTISTPHHGSKTIDAVCMTSNILLKTAAFFVNPFFRLAGDEKPDFYNACRELTTQAAERFNQTFVNSEKVYYQSYAAVMKNPLGDVSLSAQYAVVRVFDGDNDGIVSVKSAVWDGFRGVIGGDRPWGVSHVDVIDRRKANFAGVDVCDLYVGIAADLKNMGF